MRINLKTQTLTKYTPNPCKQHNALFWKVNNKYRYTLDCASWNMFATSFNCNDSQFTHTIVVTCSCSCWLLTSHKSDLKATSNDTSWLNYQVRVIDIVKHQHKTPVNLQWKLFKGLILKLHHETHILWNAMPCQGNVTYLFRRKTMLFILILSKYLKLGVQSKAVHELLIIINLKSHHIPFHKGINIRATGF